MERCWLAQWESRMFYLILGMGCLVFVTGIWMIWKNACAEDGSPHVVLFGIFAVVIGIFTVSAAAAIRDQNAACPAAAAPIHDTKR